MNPQAKLLLNKHRTGKNWYSIKSQDSDTPEIFIYDQIGWPGVEAERFIKDLDNIEASRIKIRLNTPGGNVFDGYAIFNALRQHKAKIETHIDGLAASIGSIVALAGDSVHIAKNAFFMIHDPWAMVIGTSEDMRKEAGVLDKISNTLVQTYVDRTGLPTNQVEQLMADETWFSAQESKEYGFIDFITGDEAAQASFDLNGFNNIPKAYQNMLSVKKQDELPTERQLERHLRDVGLPKQAAKAIIAKGYRALFPKRDAEDECLKAVHNLCAILAT